MGSLKKGMSSIQKRKIHPRNTYRCWETHAFAIADKTHAFAIAGKTHAPLLWRGFLSTPLLPP
jgi:hypothetical protein